MLLLKFLTSKNNPIIKDSNANIHSTISENVNILYLNSKYFNDDFTRTLIKKSGVLNRRFWDKSEILNEFNKTKNHALFSIFFKSQVSLYSNIKSIFQFILSNLIENTADFWISQFDPNYHGIYSSDSKTVKKIKALGFINYYLKNDNYPEAFSYLEYLEVRKC